MTTTGIILLAVIAGLILLLVSVYNKLVALKTGFRTASLRSMCN